MSFLVILTALGIAIYAPCTGYRRFSSVVIHDPLGISQYFSDMRQFAESRSKTEVPQWSVEELKEKCFHALVDGVSFMILDKEEVDHVSDRYNFNRRRFHTVLHQTFLLFEGAWQAPSVEVASEEVTTLLGIPTYYCAGISGDANEETEYFAIARAHPHDALFLLKKHSEDSKYKIIAMIEPIPKFDLQTFKRKDLEAVYLTGSIRHDLSNGEGRQETETEFEEDDFSFDDSFEDEDRYHRVCELDEFRKYRLCATTYTAWMQFRNDVYRDTDYILRPGDACMRKEKIFLTEKVPAKTVEADVLPCSIHTDSSNSQIFVTNDHFTNDSAFILEAVHANDESVYNSEESENGEVIGFRLVIHLHHVLSLKRFDDDE